MNRVASTTVGVIVGSAVGATAALLFAPKRGEEIRSDVWNWAKEKEHRAAGKIRETGSTVASSIREVPKTVSEKAPVVAGKVSGIFRRRTADEVERAQAIEN